MESHFPFAKPAPPVPSLQPTLPTAAALAMEIDAGLVPVLARLHNDERLQVLAAIDLAFAQRTLAVNCIKTVNIALSQAVNKDAGLDPTLTAMLADRTSKVLKLTAAKRSPDYGASSSV